MSAPLILELALAMVMAGIIWLVAILPRRREQQKSRKPFTERTLRPPGESLRLRLRELDEQFNDWLMWLFLPFGAAMGCAFGEEAGAGLGMRTIAFSSAAISVSDGSDQCINSRRGYLPVGRATSIAAGAGAPL